MSVLKVALILDKGPQSKINHEALRLAKNAKHYQITHLIVQDFSKDSGSAISKMSDYLKKKGVRALIRAVLFKLIRTVEESLLKKLWRYGDFFVSENLEEGHLEKIEVNPKVSKSGLVYRYSKRDIARIKEESFDVLIRGGSGILKGEILNSSKYGILSFHHGDNDVNRGGPAGFWEVFGKAPSTGFIIQILKEELDGGDVLFKGKIPTSFLYSMNAVKILMKSLPFLHQTLEFIGKNDSLPQVMSKKPYSFPIFKIPSVRVQLRYLFRTFILAFQKVYEKLIGRTYRWEVGYQFTPSFDDFSFWRSKRIKNPKGRFLADPFLINRNGRHYCFVEDYSFKEKLGVISVYEIEDGHYKRLGECLRESFHLSFPYLIEDKGNLYMCPETHASNDIRLYRCVDFPLRWELEKVLIPDISAADTCVFKHSGKWWLLTNVDSADMGEHCSELHIFASDDLINGAWQAHPQNPVIFDPQKARNGGLFLEQEKIYRTFQTQDWDMYGSSMGVTEITDLTDQTFKEKELFKVLPNYFPDIKGTHSFVFHEGLVAFDFVKKSSKR